MNATMARNIWQCTAQQVSRASSLSTYYQHIYYIANFYSQQIEQIVNWVILFRFLS